MCYYTMIVYQNYRTNAPACVFAHNYVIIIQHDHVIARTCIYAELARSLSKKPRS